MKLYARTTSNRASKGQGGDYLDIKLTGTAPDKEVILLGHIHVRVVETEKFRTFKVDLTRAKAEESETILVLPVSKGNKEKDEGEIPHCSKHRVFSYSCIDCASLQ